MATLVEQRERVRAIRNSGKDIRARLPAAATARSLLREVEKAAKLAEGLPDDGDKAIKQLREMLEETRDALADAQNLLAATRRHLDEQITIYPIP